MPLFSRKKKKKESGALVLTELDEILGYLEEVYRRRVPITYTINKKTYQTDILFLESKTKSMRIQSGETNRIPNGSDATAGFCLDKTWWSFKTKFGLIEDKPHLMIPKQINHNERRETSRTGFSPREQVKVTILEGLGSGNGVFGLAKDISTDGMCMHIEKAMHLASEKEVPPSPTLFKPGTKLAMVKINKIPGSPQLEISGIAKRVFRDGKWCFAFQFDKLSKAQEAMISRFIEPRVLDFKPVRRSLKKRQEMEAEMGAGAGSRAGGVAVPPGASPTTSPSASPPTTEPTPPPAATPKAAVVIDPNAPPKIKVLVVGDLVETLEFLNAARSPFEVIAGATPVGIIKSLTEAEPAAMLCGTEFKGRSMVSVLEKIAAMGVGKDVKTIVCAPELPSKDIIKFKMMKIENLLPPPPETDEDEFITKLRAFCE